MPTRTPDPDDRLHGASGVEETGPASLGTSLPASTQPFLAGVRTGFTMAMVITWIGVALLAWEIARGDIVAALFGAALLGIGSVGLWFAIRARR